MIGFPVVVQGTFLNYGLLEALGTAHSHRIPSGLSPTFRFRSDDAETMVAGFRRMLRGICDGEVLLDGELKILGPGGSSHSSKWSPVVPAGSPDMIPAYPRWYMECTWGLTRWPYMFQGVFR